MAVKSKVAVVVGIIRAGSILFLAIAVFRGKIVKEASVNSNSGSPWASRLRFP